MTTPTPTRRALSDLPINTLCTPPIKDQDWKNVTSHKRSIQEVTEPEYPPSTFRIRPSPQPRISFGDESTRLLDQPVDHASRHASIQTTTQLLVVEVSEQSRRAPASHVINIDEDIEEGDSQNSCTSIADFDLDDTINSQQTAATEMTQSLQSRASHHAETLRLRLRLAHFKVRTNQTNIPLAQLQISKPDSPDTPDQQPTSLPTLLPAPILLPTAYSARMNTQCQILSSPPSSPESGVGRSPRHEVFRTPALPRHSTAIRQTSSPPDSQERTLCKNYIEEEDLTSSVVKGKAAIGLLGLRQER